MLTASNLVDLGVKDIWAKADSDAHGKILTQVGADHVVRPERDTGRRIAHLLGGRFEEFAQFDEHYGMIKLAPPTILLGWPLDTVRLWERYKVRAISVRHPGDTWVPLSSGDYLSKDDQIIVAGDPEKLEMFANK